MMRRRVIRVAFLTADPQLYGSNRSLLDLIEGLGRWDVVPYVIAASASPFEAELSLRSIPHACLKTRTWMSKTASWSIAASHLFDNAIVLPRLMRQLRSWKVDIVHTNALQLPIGAIASAVIRRPHVWHFRDCGDIHFGMRFEWGRPVTRRVFDLSQCIIAISTAVRDHWSKDICSDKFRVIYNGVLSIVRFDELRKQAERKQVAGQVKTFVLIGRLHPNKGQSEAIRALGLLVKHHPRIRLILAGDGDPAYRRGLQQLAVTENVERNVEFLGYVKDPFAVLNQSDAALMCSRHEGMGRVTAEAMAACLPVIGFRSGGTAELINHRNTGLLYENGPEELAGLMQLLIDDSVLRLEMGRNGWAYARQHFTIEAYAEKVREAYDSVL